MPLTYLKKVPLSCRKIQILQKIIRQFSYQRCKFQHRNFHAGVSPCFQYGHYSTGISISNPVERSALYISPTDDKNTAVIDLDLDFESQLLNLEVLGDNLRRRGMDFDLDQWVADYINYKRLKIEVEDIQDRRSDISRQMANIVRQKNPSAAQLKEKLIKEGKELKMELKKLSKPLWEIEERVTLQGLRLPNQIHPSVPQEDTGVEDSRIISQRSSELLPKEQNVQKRLQENDLLEFSTISPTAYYMKGDLALLEQAISGYAQDSLEKEGFTPVVCPDMVKSVVVEGCGVDVSNPNEAFRVQRKEDELSTSSESDNGGNLSGSLFLTGSSHFGMVASVARMMVNEISLPMKCFTIGRNYRSVKNSEENSLMSVAQATEYHLFSSCKSPSRAEEMVSSYIDVLSRIYQPFDLQMRLVNIGAKCLHPSESRRIELECWLPSAGNFIKLASVSSCDDYISRRLMMQCSKNMSSPPRKYQHIVHGCAFSIPWFITALLENATSHDEQLVLPEVLKSFWIGPLPYGVFTFLDT